MATGDERREVAEALRGDPTETLIEQTRDGFEGMTYHEAAYRFWDMCRRVRSVANVDIANSTCSVLAGLIDPTCEVDSVEPIEGGELDDVIVGYAFHLTCGHCAERPYRDELPKYCDECGRRVIDED